MFPHKVEFRLDARTTIARFSSYNLYTTHGILICVSSLGHLTVNIFPIVYAFYFYDFIQLIRMWIAFVCFVITSITLYNQVQLSVFFYRSNAECVITITALEFVSSKWFFLPVLKSGKYLEATRKKSITCIFLIKKIPRCWIKLLWRKVSLVG